MQRRTPLARTPFKRKEPKPFALADRKTQERRAEMKRRIKKPTVAEGSKYLAACRGEPCYLRVFGVCSLNPDDDTIVPCHSNLLEHGKGKGIKAAHEFTFPGCGACHFWLDQSKVPTKEQRRAATLAALARWVPVRAAKMGIELKEAA
jgi:ferredoxin